MFKKWFGGGSSSGSKKDKELAKEKVLNRMSSGGQMIDYNNERRYTQ